MGSFTELSRKLRQIGRNVISNSDALVRKTALAIDGTVVLATPVDTGRARANWQVEIDQPNETTTENLSPSGREAIEQGKQKIPEYVGGKPEAAIYITNNLPYIGRLNEGHSAQAPAAFVERAVNVGVRAIKNAKVTVGKVNENST